MWLLLAASAASALPPVPPPLSPTQANYLGHVHSHAAAASVAARPGLLKALGDKALVAGLRRCCRPLAEMSPAELLDWIHRQATVSELVHNFEAVGTQNPHDTEIDLSVYGMSDAWFFNLWEPYLLGLWNVSDATGPEDRTEVGVFGMSDFSNGATPATLSEAAERPIYTAWNMRNVDAGNPHWGDVSMVFSPGFAVGKTIVAPMDTGLWTMVCNRTQPGSAASSAAGVGRRCARAVVRNAASFHPPFHPNCNVAGWSLPSKTFHLGTLEHYDHLLLSGPAFWHDATASDQLLTLLHRMHDPSSLNITGFEIFKYFEADIVATVPYNGAGRGGIKMVLATFTSLFGTAAGQRLREWCIRQRWVLLWALGPNLGPGVDTMNSNVTYAADASRSRVVDPSVFGATAAASNSTGMAGLDRDFDAVWAAVAAANTSNTTSAAAWGGWWEKVPRNLGIAALRAGDCADIDGCIGTWRTPAMGSCVCYK